MELWQLSALEQAALVKSGEVSARELVDAAIARIEKLDPQLGALVDTRFERARAEAEGALPDGPFRGVPMLLKDAVQHSAGDRYQHGLRFLRDREYRSPADTELTRRYKAAGFVVLGRTKVPEMTCAPTTEPLAHGACRNPWNPEFMAGGSSGGSAAAVASGMVAVGHANDMGGSIRIPAACCGLVGLKPTRQRTSIAPYGQYWGPLVHEHVVTRTVGDSAAVLDATAGPAPGELYTAPPPLRRWHEELGRALQPLRIGLILSTPFSGEVDPQCRAAAEGVARWLEGMGHTVELVNGDVLGHLAGWAHVGCVTSSGIAQAIDHWENLFGEPVTDLEPTTRDAVETGRATRAPELLAAIDGLGEWSQKMVAEYSTFDLLVMPTMPQPPLPLGTIDPLQPKDELLMAHGAVSSFTLPFNVTGQPAISLPVAWNDAGLPIGVQLVADHGREDLLFRAAALLERHYAWPQRWPVMAGA